MSEINLVIPGELHGHRPIDIFVYIQKHFNKYSKPARMIVSNIMRTAMDVQAIRDRKVYLSFGTTTGKLVTLHQEVPVEISDKTPKNTIIMEYV